MDFAYFKLSLNNSLRYISCASHGMPALMLEQDINTILLFSIINFQKLFSSFKSHFFAINDPCFFKHFLKGSNYFLAAYHSRLQKKLTKELFIEYLQKDAAKMRK